MDSLSSQMQQIIRDFSAGAVATVNDDGTPAVSPKATFIVLDETHIAFGDIRSPGTVRNIRSRPAVEVLFTDVIARRAVRITGTAEVVGHDHPLRDAMEPFTEYIDRMRNFVVITVERALLVTSPAYDVGHTEDELRRLNLAKLNSTQAPEGRDG